MRRLLLGSSVLGGLSAMLLLAPAVQTQNAGNASAGVEMVGGHEAVANEALVKFRRPLAGRDREAVGGAVNAERMTAVGRGAILRVRSRSLGAADLVATLARRADVEFAEPNYIVRATVIPNDPRFPELWGLTKIHAPDAWDISTGSADAVVAVIDTGVDYLHADLAANIWSAPSPFTVSVGGTPINCAAGTHGFNAINRRCDPMDDHDHGTHVSGTIGAVGQNGTGVVGVNWTTRIMGIKFLDAGGSGDIADAIDGIAFAIEAKKTLGAAANIRILSNSWGGGGFSQAMFDEINAANQENMLFVAAAGNSSSNNDGLPAYPASYQAPNVIAVAASTSTDNLAWFSNYGRSSVHLAAPGDGILSTTIGGSYESFSGTSMATPHVSGAAALLVARCGYNTAELKEALLGSVEAVAALSSFTITGGRLDLNSAIHTCLAPPPTPQDLRATAGDAKVTLNWTTSLGASRYIVKRSTTAGGPYTTIASNASGAQYVDTAVLNGTAYYYVVSAANSLGESADSNEASATPHAPPDLYISAVTVPYSVGAGSTISVPLTVRNQGTGFAEPSITRLYLTPDPRLDATDLALTPEYPVPLLQPGATSSVTLSIVLPADVSSGQYYVATKADANEAVSESQEINNITYRSIAIGPDLLISAMTVPTAAAAGGPATVSWTVKNQGGGGAAETSIRFHLSSNTILDASDTPLAESGSVPGLAAAATAPGTTTVTIPASTTVGSYYLIGQADAGNAVPETSETNNTTVRMIQVGGDLVVSSMTVPSLAGAGAAIVVTDTTKNQGSNGLGASVTRFYLSVNAVLDANDTRLDGFREVPALAAGASSTGSTSVTIPAGTPTGTFYVIGVADADNAVAETQESNNVLPRGVNVGPDLLVSSLSLPVPSKAAAGQPVTVTDTTKNQGGGSTTPTVTAFYLSVDLKVDAADVTLGGVHQVPALAGGGTHAAATTFTIPGETAAGTYYVLAVADVNQTIAETQELNNVGFGAIQIGPDLIASTATISPYSVAAGSSTTVTDTVVNQGGGPAGASTARFYLSVDFRLDANDVLLNASRGVPPLAAGASSAGSTPVPIPATTAAGYYYLLEVVDADSAVGEVYENNNVLMRSIQVTAAP